MRSSLLTAAVLLSLLILSATGADHRLSRRLQAAQPAKSPLSPSKPAGNATVPASHTGNATRPASRTSNATAPASPTHNTTARTCKTLAHGTLINITAVREPVTTCIAASALSNATITTKDHIKNTTFTYLNATATNCTVNKGAIVPQSCQTIGGVTVPSSPQAPSPVPATPPPPHGKKKSSAGPAAGGAIGGVLVLAIIAGLVWFYVIRKRGSQPGAPYSSKQPLRATPTDAAAYHDQGNGRPTTFVVGKDPAMLSRRHEDLKQAVQSFESRLLSVAPAGTGFWHRLVAQAPALEAAMPAAALGPYLLRHQVWRWLDAKLWTNAAPLAKPPIFPRGRSTSAYDSALTELKGNTESYRKFSSQVAHKLAQDLQLPAEGQATYKQELQYLVECAVELRLAVGAVDPHAVILVAHIDTGASPLRLQAASSSQQVFRSLAVDPAAASRITNGVALCHVPGVGHRTSSYAYEKEQVVVAARL